MQQINVGKIQIEIERKRIKNVHLSVRSPDGRVHVSAPMRIHLGTIRQFVVSKVDWIKKQQSRILLQSRETPLQYVDQERHLYLGHRYPLKLVHHEAAPKIILSQAEIALCIRPGTDTAAKGRAMDGWYRERLKEIIPDYIRHWEPLLQVKVNQFAVKKMKTRWGSCNTRAGRIWLSLELAKKPMHCLEYVIVHEMVHLKTRNHGPDFKAGMNQALPNWKVCRAELNRLPVVN